MTRWQFDEDMIIMLKRVVGKRFLSFERDSSAEGQAYSVARLNFEDVSILLKNEEEEISMFEDESVPYEEAAKFTCSKCDPAQQFMPGLADVPVKRQDVNELVTEIDVVSDLIRSFEHEINIVIDIALIIRTENHAYIFSKSHVWFDEVIYIDLDKSIDDICPLHSDLALWNNDGAWNVTIERTIRKL